MASRSPQDSSGSFDPPQGKFIEEFCYGEKAENERRMKDCKKYPGHEGFIHSKEFNLGHLPEKYKDNTLLGAIRCVAELTVLVVTYFSSENRDADDNPGIPARRTGSGWVWKIKKYDDNPCKCEKCVQSGIQSKVWWDIFVMTANHVVLDKSECKEAYVSFNYEQNNTEVRLKGRSMSVRSYEADRGIFVCTSCDEEFCTRLVSLCRQRKEGMVECNRKFSDDYSMGLTVVVSHPHESEKRISTGFGVSREDQELASRYTYDAPTCPGSSGGFVWFVGWGLDHAFVAAHRGASEYGEQENESAWSWPL